MRLLFAKLISFLLNPLFLIVFLPFFLVYKTTHDVTIAFSWTLYTAGFIFFLALTVFIAVKRGIFTDMDVSKREQRPLLFLVSILFGIAYLTGLSLFHAPFILYIITYGVMVGIVLVSFINKRIKASIHVATVTGMVLAVAIGYGGYYYLLLGLIPLLGWARVKTKRHTLREAITGGFLGTFLSISMYSAYLAAKVLLHK